MVDAGAAEAAFRSVVASTAELASLRHLPSCGVSSLAVNGPRVDVVAGDGVDEWRVVFFVTSPSNDLSDVASVSIFRRPAPLAVVHRGLAVIVNGPSSAGKSTLIRELNRVSRSPWVTFDEPMFGDVDIEYLIWRDRAEVLHRGFLDGIAALARAGN